MSKTLEPTASSSPKSGYKNFETNDNSRNIHLPFILMHPYHNNHHADPSNLTIAVKWYEIDHIKFLINLLKKSEKLYGTTSNSR